MPPITVLAIEEHNEGYLVHWRDAANLDGQPLEGFFHITDASIEDLVRHQRKPNRAPDGLLRITARRMADHRRASAEQRAASLTAVGDAFADAYGELLQDRIDRRNLGMKAVTRDGHADLLAVRAGAPVREWNRRAEGDSALRDFAARRATN